MAYILSLLFMSLFISAKKDRWFLQAYVLLLLMAGQVRALLKEYDYCVIGKCFFQFYSYWQFIIIAFALFLLQKKTKGGVVTCLLLFSLYNQLIYSFWGALPLAHYDLISLLILLSICATVTLKEHSLRKNILMTIVATLAAAGQARYI